MRTLVRRFIQEDEGQDMIEYALLAAFISIVAWQVIQSIGTDVSTIYSKVEAATTGASS